MTLGRQVFTLAHELGHAFFHSQTADVVVSMAGRDYVRERFADGFAGEFLVPGDELRRVAGELEGFETLGDPIVVVHLQRHFGVSFATIRVRMLQEKLLTTTSTTDSATPPQPTCGGTWLQGSPCRHGELRTWAT